MNNKKTSRRNFMKLCGKTLAAGSFLAGSYQGFAQIAGNKNKRPNMVIILADDQRFDALACMGHPFAKTPHTDRLAQEGTLFTQATVTTPLCGPNRACMFTGNYAHNHHLRHNGMGVENPKPMPVPCFPALLRDNGYETALFGKFHDGESTYADHGFTHFEPCKNADDPFTDPEFQDKQGNWIRHKGHLGYIIPEKAENWIKQTYKEAPFLAVLSHVAPHLPVVVPEDKKELYADKTPLRRPNVNNNEGHGRSEHTRGGQAWFRGMRQSGKFPNWTYPPPNSDERIRDRMRLNTVLDDSVGRIYRVLEEIGELDNTIFVYHSDNGYFLGEHGLAEKYYPYEEALRVPLIIRYPKFGGKNGQMLDSFVHTIDIAPTLLEAAGIKIPQTVDGKSLKQLIGASESIDWRQETFHEFFFHKGENPHRAWAAIRCKKWKYAYYPQEGFEELYNLESDPYEITNIALNEDYKDVLKDKRQILSRFVNEEK